MELTKWPRLLVAGEPVTREQANDILIRTNHPYLDSNDQQWTRLVCREYGMPIGRYGRPDYEEVRAVRQQLRVLDLHYLDNAQIVSTWIGGPYGWCDWDGRIGCSTFNIGKWPTREEVQEDLDAIASAWPFLRMDVQLVTDEGEGELAAMWVVADGKAVYAEPGDALPITELTEAAILERMLVPGGERGVTIERLCGAIAQVRATRGNNGTAPGSPA